MSGLARRIGIAADWTLRARPRLPVIGTGPDHPPWVGRALTDCLPLLALVVATGVLRLLDKDWAWFLAALAYGAYLLVFAVFPWLVNIARSFVAGYRGS